MQRLWRLTRTRACCASSASSGTCSWPTCDSCLRLGSLKRLNWSKRPWIPSSSILAAATSSFVSEASLNASIRCSFRRCTSEQSCELAWFRDDQKHTDSTSCLLVDLKGFNARFITVSWWTSSSCLHYSNTAKNCRHVPSLHSNTTEQQDETALSNCCKPKPPIKGSWCGKWSSCWDAQPDTRVRQEKWRQKSTNITRSSWSASVFSRFAFSRKRWLILSKPSSKSSRHATAKLWNKFLVSSQIVVPRRFNWSRCNQSLLQDA